MEENEVVVPEEAAVEAPAEEVDPVSVEEAPEVVPALEEPAAA